MNYSSFKSTDLIKYVFICTIAIFLGIIVFSFSPFDKWLIDLFKVAVKYHLEWNTYSHTYFSWLASGAFLISLMLGFIAYPFILLILISLKIARKSWLPKNDPNLLKLINYWLDISLVAFLITLLARSLETINWL